MVSTRTVLTILADPDKEKGLRRYADRAAIDICNDPPRVPLHDIERLPSGQGSTLLFIRPIRSKDNSDYGNSMFIIPTIRLSEIFDSRCQGLSVQSRLRLHEVFSMRPATKGVAGWLHMHLQMMGTPVSQRHEIFNSSTKSHMNSAAMVLVGTISALRAAVRDRLLAIYWSRVFLESTVSLSTETIFTLCKPRLPTGNWCGSGTAFYLALRYGHRQQAFSG